MIQGPVRVRFAPSPTGYLHVGGARTAIYNDLLRHSLGGVNILRIEDTDQERSDAAMVQQIESAMEWLGMVSDEGPFLQSEGLADHAAAAQVLLDRGLAYRDYSTSEEMDALRLQAQKQGFPIREGRLIEAVGAEAWSQRAEAGQKAPVRLRFPGEPIVIDDLVRGEVVFQPEVLDDFIILRSDGTPTYHLSVVCDDSVMKITHVIRGEDHLSNTPKHIVLFEALGVDVPCFAHLPLILGDDKKRLSKRTGAASVEEFREQGILAEALYNYLALLGWSPGDDREVFLSRAELVEAFSADRLLGSASVFDVDKLGWINAQHMSGQPLEEILRQFRPFAETAGIPMEDEAKLGLVVDLHRTRARTLKDLAERVLPHYLESLEYSAVLCQKFLKTEGMAKILEILANRFEAEESFSAEAIERVIRALAQENDLKAGVLIHPTRMAVSGAKAGPSLFHLVEVVGQAATVRHLRNLAGFLGSLNQD